MNLGNFLNQIMIYQKYLLKNFKEITKKQLKKKFQRNYKKTAKINFKEITK